MRIKNLKISLLFICLIICLFGCGKKEVHIEGTFGSDDNYTSLESENNKSGVEITVEETDKFKVTDEDVDLTTTKPVKSEEEKSIDRAESEYQSLDVEGNITDSRDKINYRGLLEFIKEQGGIEKVASTYSKEVFTEELNKFELVTVEEKQQVLEAIYNASSEERKLLINDLLHTEDGWVYTDSGWVNVYEQENSVDGYDLGGE